MSNKSSFTKLLLDLSNGLTSEELRQLKHLCRDDIGAAKLEQIERGYELFQELENRDLLSKDKRDYLATKLADVGKRNLSRSLSDFQEEESPPLASLDELRRHLPNVRPTAPPSARRRLDDEDSGAGADSQADYQNETGQEIHEAPPEVFISYKWEIQETVKSLVSKLREAGYRCWMDISQMGEGDRMNEKISEGISNSKVVICCVTKRFCESTVCQDEVTLAKNLGKPIIPVLFESMQWPPQGQLRLIFTSLLYIKMYETPGNFPEEKLEQLLNKVGEHIRR